MVMMTGVVEDTSSKTVTTKFGIKPTYSFRVDGTWIKSGFKNPSVNVGDQVEFDGVSGSYGVETKAVVILSRGSGAWAAGASSATPTPAAKSYTGGGGRVFPIPPLHGDRSIVRQNAVARATELYIGARGGKPFDLGEDVVDIVLMLARKIEAYTAGDLDMAAAMVEEEVL